MLMAVGLLISTTMSAMPERPVPPEPKAPEGIEMPNPGAPEALEGVELPKPEAPKAPVSVAKVAPRKAAMGGNVATIIHDGVETPYTDWATMMAAVQDDDEIRLEADHTGAITLDKAITLNLYGNTINCLGLTSGSAVTVKASGTVIIKSGTIKAEYYKVDGVTVESGSTIIEDVQMKSQYTDSYGWGQYGVGYGVNVAKGATATIKGNSVLDCYYWLKNEGTLTIEGNAVIYEACTGGCYGIYNQGTLNISGGKVIAKGNYGIYNTSSGTVNLSGGEVTTSGFYGVYNNGGTLTITNDASVQALYYAVGTQGGKVSVQGGSLSTTSTGTSYYICALLVQGENAEVEISGGKLTDSDTYGYCVYNNSTTGNVTISGGTINSTYIGILNQGTAYITAGTINSENYAAYCDEGTMNISGGTFNGKKYAVYCYNGTTNISGGTFNGVEGDVQNFGTLHITGGTFHTTDADLEPGYAYSKNQDGTYTVKPGNAQIVGGDAYSTLSGAVTVAQTNDELKLTNNITEDVSVDKSLTINTQKYTMTGKLTVTGSARVEIIGNGEITEFEGLSDNIRILSGVYHSENFKPYVYTDGGYNYAKQSDGSYLVGKFVAQIGEGAEAQYFFNLQSAFDAVSEDNEQQVTIKVLNDFTESVEISFYGNRNVKLDLNRHTLSLDKGVSINVSAINGGTYTPSEKDKLTIVNGELKSLNGGTTIYPKGGEVTLEDMTLTNTKEEGIGSDGNTLLTIGQGVTINADVSVDDFATLTNYGTIHGSVSVSGGGTFNMNGGEISTDAKNYTIKVVESMSELNISGGTVINSYADAESYTIHLNNSSCYFTHSGGHIVKENGGCELEIVAGNCTFEGGTYAHNVSTLPEGYDFVQKAANKYEVKKILASINGGEQHYYSWEEVMNAVQEGDVINLLTDIEPNDDATINNKTANVFLDIATHLIRKKLIVNGTDLKVIGNGVILDLEGNVKIVRAKTAANPQDYLAEGSTFKKDGELYRVYPEKVAKMEVAGKETFYSSVFDAFKNLPLNSTPATVTLLADEYMEYVGQPNKVAKYQNVTLNLNGFAIYGSTNYANQGSAIIMNNGKLTVKDGSKNQTGAIYNSNTNPYDWKADGYQYPTQAYNIFTNEGTLIIEGGYFESVVDVTNDAKSNGYACYVVDNNNNGGGNNAPKPYLIINGGHLKNNNAPAIRLNLNNKNKENTNYVIINGGIIEGYDCIWVQLYKQGSDENKANYISECPAEVTINGGVFKTTENQCNRTENPVPVKEGSSITQVSWKDDHTWASDGSVKFTINGGTFDVNFWMAAGTDFSISGGTFNGYVYSMAPTKTVTGGIFDFNGGWSRKDAETHAEYKDIFERDYMAEGYCMFPIGKSETDYVYEVKVCDPPIEIKEDKTITDPEEIKPSDILVVTGNEENPVTVTIGSDAEHPIEVNVNTITGDGEAQIVVKDGATLNVGNGGLVSENNELVFVKVEAGGKMTIGNGGLDQIGDKYPIIVENNGDKSGVYMVSPDAQSPADETKYDITKPEATVRVYTRAYLTATSEHWQHFACPVQTGVGLDGVATQVKMVPLNVNPDDPVLTVINEWDYNTDKWKIMPVNGGAEYFGNDGWTTDITMKPFYAYNLLNNSRPTDEGITYEFHGNLVGNEDMKLFFPEHGFCFFGNSYTAPIDLSALFAKVKSDIKTGNIDLCVYIYNSQDDRFENVNEEQLALEEEYGIKAPFKQIPPQQAFIMNLTTGNTGETSVDYRKAVWGNKQSNLNVPIRAPKAMGNDYTNIVRVAVADAMSADNVTLVEGYNFDETYNYGSDAYKYMDNKNFNLYASTEAGQLAMVADNSIEGTILTLQAGKAMEYTLTFPNVLGTDYQLIDLLTGTAIQMVEGNEYTFTAQPNSVVDRFMVVAINKAPTSMDKIQTTKEAKGVYSILGQSYGEKLNVNALPQGVYIINGVKVVK